MNNSISPHMMKKTGLALLVVVLMASLTIFNSCKDDDEPSIDKVSEIAGTWTTTKATFNGTDVVLEGGRVTLAIQSNGRFTFELKRPGKTDMVFTGKLGFDEEWLALEYDTLILHRSIHDRRERQLGLL